MLSLPTRFAAVVLWFAPLSCHRSWRHAEVLLIGAILAPGRRTAASILDLRQFDGQKRRSRPTPIRRAFGRNGGEVLGG